MISTPLVLSIVFLLSPVSISAKPTKAFVELTRQPYYVDKTELLHVVSEFHHSYDFIACPSRFLKTSNLQMIKSFYQYEFDDNGHAKKYTDTETYAFFKNFKIFNHSEVFLKNRMANHPVMLIELKFNVSEVKTIAEVDALLNTKLREAFQEYFAILPKLPNPTGEFEITKFETEFMQKLQNGTASHFDLTYGLYRLSNVLFKYFKRRVIILIDDFDYAADQAVLKHNHLLDTDGAVYYFYTSISNMFRKTFKKNRQFKNYAMMTGISGRIEYADKEVVENHFLDEHVFTPYFGFTEIDVDNLLTRYNCVYTEYDLIKSYYRGYLTRLENRNMFSPYSIVQCVLSRAKPEQEYKLMPYWAKTENHDFINQALESDNFREKLTQMVDSDSKYVNITNCLKSSPALDVFVRSINERKPTFKGIHQLDVRYLFNHLLETGYLGHSMDGPIAYGIPNMEIRDALRQILDGETEEEDSRHGVEDSDESAQGSSRRDSPTEILHAWRKEWLDVMKNETNKTT